MVSNRSKKLKIVCSLVILFTVALTPLADVSDSRVQANEFFRGRAAPSVSAGAYHSLGDTGDLTITLEAGQYEISEEGEYSVIAMEGFGSILSPGEPKLPSKTFLIGLPPGAEAVSVDLVNQSYAEIPGEYRIMPAPPIISGQGNEKVKRGENEEIYSSENPYPSSPYEYLGMGQMRKYNFARVGFCPVAYYPAGGKLGLYRSITLKIKYEITQVMPPELLADTVMDDVASGIIFNYAPVMSQYQQAVAPSSTSYSYVIITTDSLQSTVEPLVTWKTTIGYSVNVVTTSWISSNYAGIDLPERIRNFLTDKYTEWGIQYVLIVGSHSTIPMRYCYPNPSDHNPNSDSTTPTDYYYADLTGNWDSDGDGYFGEYGQDSVDFYPEVYVGRIPVDNSAMVNSICQKSVDFEQDSGSWKKKALLLGAISNYANEAWTDWDKTDGAALMEECWNDILSVNGYSRERMYETAGESPSNYACDHALTNSNVLNPSYGWPSGYGIVNLDAHGDAISAARWVWEWDDGDGIPESDEMGWHDFISSSDVPYLDNSKPAVVFSDSCLTAYPEQTNNLGKSLLQQGAVAFVGATRSSSGTVGWQNEGDGGCASIDYYFFHYLINQAQECGDALYKSKEYYLDHFTGGPWESWEWCHWQNMFEFCLYGDPSLGMATIASNNPPYTPSNPSPANHATGLDINTDLSWTGGDPDAGDTVTHDAYFGTIPTPPLVSNDQLAITYDLGTLQNDTTYYWYIVATDNHGAPTAGPVWDFTTIMTGQPDITVSPTSFDVTLPPDTIQDYALTISNDGGVSISYDISDTGVTGGVSAAGGENLSWMKPASMVLEVPLESSPVDAQNIGQAQSGWQDIMSEDFEGAFPGVWDPWVSPGATDAYWGKDKYRAHRGSYSAFCAKDGSAGVNPPGDYPMNMDAWMIYGPFSLEDAIDAELSFYYWLDSEYGYDYLWWGASIDGEMFYGYQLSGYIGGWASESLDLSRVPTLWNICGESQVWIAFAFESDDIISYGGAFIDDVVLRKYVAAVNNPPNTPSNPSPANHTTGVSVNADLSWTGGDPDTGDTVTYDVYFDTSETPPLVSDNQAGTSYDPGTLADNTKYYWKITATDNHGASTVGPVWEFSTGKSCLDEPGPEVGFASLISEGKLVIAYNFDPFTTVPTAMNGWTWFDPALPPGQSNLAKLSKYTAYWVKVTEECWLTYGSQTYHLAAGWNNPVWLGC